MSVILVVDDEPLIVDMVREALVAEGHQVVPAYSGEEALEQVEKSAPDLIVLDLMLPGMDGLAVTRQLQRDARYSHVPIIMLTAKGSVEDRTAGYERGADDYIAKPFDPEELMIRVRRQLQHLNGDGSGMTGLPGSAEIERVLRERTADPDGHWAIIYVAIEHFDAFNESVSFGQGDEMIMAAASDLQQALAEEGDDDDFLGHIGSDDFVVVTRRDHAEALIKRAADLFTAQVPGFFASETVTAGAFAYTDHEGRTRHIPLADVALDFDVLEDEE